MGIYKENKVLPRVKKGEEKYIPTRKRVRSDEGDRDRRKYSKDYSLRYLSRIAGVSTTTIANIFNEPWKVSVDTRQEVKDKLREIGVTIPKWEGGEDDT